MMCPVCQREGTTSTLSVSTGSVVTGMPIKRYYDTEGREHWHDPNSSCTSARCSNGHRLLIVNHPGCSVPGCTFGIGSTTIQESRTSNKPAPEATSK